MTTDVFKLAKATAEGRWEEYLEGKLGMELNDNKPTGCPVCGEGEDRFTFDDKHGGGEWFCRGPKVTHGRRQPHYGDGLTLAAEYLTKASGEEVKPYDIAHDVLHHFQVTADPVAVQKTQAKKAKRTEADDKKLEQALSYFREARANVKAAAREDEGTPVSVAYEKHPYFVGKRLSSYMVGSSTGTALARRSSGLQGAPRCIVVEYVDPTTTCLCGVELIAPDGSKRTTGKKGAHYLPYYQGASEALVVEGWATGVALNQILRQDPELSKRYRVVVAGGCGTAAKTADLLLKHQGLPAHVIHEDDGNGTPAGALAFPVHNGNDCADWLHHRPTVNLFINQLKEYANETNA